MTQRRYSEDEVAAIFERATETGPNAVSRSSSTDGLTLAELQEIGREVGIPADAITRAAVSLEATDVQRERTLFGLTLGVERIVPLQRPLTEAQWEHLVVSLRETFDARGTVRSDGSLREWTNGNLQALHEPTPSGARLRLRTMKGNAVATITGGLGMLGISGSALAVALSQGGTDSGALIALGTCAVWGAAMFTSTLLRLPGWARQRRAQMEAIAARVAAVDAGATIAADHSRPE